MSTNIRHHLPAVYRELVDEWPALEKWDTLYLTTFVGQTLVLGYNYFTELQLRPFAGASVIEN